MGRIGINEKKQRRVKALVRVIRGWRGLKESSRTSKWEFAFAISVALREGQNY